MALGTRLGIVINKYLFLSLVALLVLVSFGPNVSQPFMEGSHRVGRPNVFHGLFACSTEAVLKGFPKDSGRGIAGQAVVSSVDMDHNKWVEG